MSLEEISTPANASLFEHLAPHYHQARPQLPSIVPQIVCAWADIQDLRLAVDLGAGTGLASQQLAHHASRVVGVEPNDQMRAYAESVTAHLPNLSFRHGRAETSGLPSGVADLVCCSQSFHWMDPDRTLREIDRLLRPGGCLVICDYDLPPLLPFQLEDAFLHTRDRAREFAETEHLYTRTRRWDKAAHMIRLHECQLFARLREIALHHSEPGNVERLLSICTSQSIVALALRHGATEEELGLTALRKACQDRWNDEHFPLFFSFRLRMALKAPNP